MKERQLRRWCKRELRNLGARPPLKVEGLCRLLGKHRGRSIHLLAHRFPTHDPSGLWLATDTADYIFYQQETSTVHQNHIITHEVGHILAGHRGSEMSGEILEGMMPHLSPDAVRRMLQRTTYQEEQEREAELFASIIMEFSLPLDERSAPPEDSPAYRMGMALSGGRGWL